MAMDALTKSGASWVVPEVQMANQADKLGSEEHKQLMVKMIRKLQSQFILPIVSGRSIPLTYSGYR